MQEPIPCLDGLINVSDEFSASQTPFKRNSVQLKDAALSELIQSLRDWHQSNMKSDGESGLPCLQVIAEVTKGKGGVDFQTVERILHRDHAVKISSIERFYQQLSLSNIIQGVDPIDSDAFRVEIEQRCERYVASSSFLTRFQRLATPNCRLTEKAAKELKSALEVWYQDMDEGDGAPSPQRLSEVCHLPKKTVQSILSRTKSVSFKKIAQLYVPLEDCSRTEDARFYLHRDCEDIVLENEELEADIQLEDLESGVVAQGIASRRILDRLESDCFPPDPIVHIVVAAFWKKGGQSLYLKEASLRIPGVPSESLPPLMQDKDIDRSISLRHFSRYFNSLVEYALDWLVCQKISLRYLLIHLFLPMDLLSNSFWCEGVPSHESYLHEYPIVLGCSDRYGQARRASHLFIQLTSAWTSRFKPRLKSSDGSERYLSDLEWLDSANAATQSFWNYSGFRCRETFLSSGELKHWGKLISSGIPLALWLSQPVNCCTSSESSKSTDIIIRKSFDDLVSCTLQDFPLQIVPVREEIRERCNSSIGVLYEDPAYSPACGGPLVMPQQPSLSSFGEAS